MEKNTFFYKTDSAIILYNVTKRNRIVTVRSLLSQYDKSMISLSIQEEVCNMTIGEKIKQERKAMGLSQEQLAEKIMVSRAAVAKWENDIGVPDIENLKKLSELFHISIDEIVGNIVQNDTGKTEKADKSIYTTKAEEYYASYIGKKCLVEMIDWNDGIQDSYILSQDERFLYYAKIEKKCTTVGALTKAYIEKIAICSKKEKKEVDLSVFSDIKRDFFLNRPVDIYLEDKHIWDGIFTEDTEILDTGIADISDECIRLISGREIEIGNVTKIETIF